MKYLLSILCLFVLSCTSASFQRMMEREAEKERQRISESYHIIDEYDEFDKKRIITESNNYLKCSTHYKHWVTIDLGISLNEYDVINDVFLNFTYCSDKDWPYINGINTLQFIFEDGEILKLSSNLTKKDIINIIDVSFFYESGIIILDKDDLYKLTTKKIEKLRLKAKRNIDFNDKEKWPSRYGKFLNDVQDRWKDFTSLYLKDWLNK